ncbi:MAG: glycosyltransferase family 2 protein [Gaiellaceae bacterium]
MEEFEQVTVVTLNWNSYDDTRECIESLRKSSYSPLEVVIIDNASVDGSEIALRNWLDESAMLATFAVIPRRSRRPIASSTHDIDGMAVHLFVSEENLGFCVGNNVGLDFAFSSGSAYSLVLNNDTICEPTTVAELVAVARETDAGLVGGLIYYGSDHNRIWWAGGSFDRNLETKRFLSGRPMSALTVDVPYDTQWISGCMTLVPRATYEMVGGYDEDFFIWSEEWDLSLRVSGAGKRLVVAPRAHLYHKTGQSLGVLYPLSYYYGTRNRLMLKRKHLSPVRRRIVTAVFLATRIPRYALLLAQGRRDLVAAGLDAIRDYFADRTGKWARHEVIPRPKPRAAQR